MSHSFATAYRKGVRACLDGEDFPERKDDETGDDYEYRLGFMDAIQARGTIDRILLMLLDRVEQLEAARK